MARVMVVGGAGYVGSHCARALERAGHHVITFDNLSTGYRQAVIGELIEGDIRNQGQLEEVLGSGIDCVLQFAARIAVGESVQDPLGYYDVNLRGTLTLLAAMRSTGVDKLVFSSTAAVYGLPEQSPIPEGVPMAPINPYGETKVAIEWALEAAHQVGALHAIRLRYFNACGASEDAFLGEAHDPETHLIPIALRCAMRGEPIKVFGNDYPTPDGTAVRDYIHVLDLAAAHLRAVEHLVDGASGGAFNLGTGTGNSVREVLDTVDAVTGTPLERIDIERRPGDSAELVADPSLAQEVLGWRAERTLRDAIADAWRWHNNPRYGPGL